MEIPPFQPHRPPEPPQSLKSKFQGLTGIIVALGIGALKYGLLLLKSLKTVLSMLFMIWIYSMFFGWPYAVGFVVLLFVHEMGHVIAAKCVGLPVSAPMFIPFAGAYIVMNENPRDAWTEALVGYGGPLAGCIGSWICLFLGIYLDTDWIVAVASTSFVLNLFNMIPVPPLDGGRICAAVSPWFWFVGLLLLGGALLYFHNWFSSLIIIGIVFFMTLPRLKQTFFSEPSPQMQDYYNTHISNRLTMAMMYLGLFAALVLGYMHASQRLSYLWEQN